MQDDVIVSTAQTLSINPNQEPSLSIFLKNSEPLVTIRPDGKIEYGPNYTPDAAAKVMWDAFGFHRALYHAAPDMLAALQAFVAANSTGGDSDRSRRIDAACELSERAIRKATGQQS